MELSGIYVARVKVGGNTYPAAAFADPKRKVLEAYILDEHLDLYGKEITIELLKKLRESEIFTDDKSLRATIADDIQNVRMHFKSL